LGQSEPWRVVLVDPAPSAPVGELDLPATVPGCVHVDLLANGVIANPMVGRNEEAQHWVGESGWEYRLTFDYVPAAGSTDLVFDGLDTFATVTLNGVELGRTQNMHRTYRFDVSKILRDHTNDLVVHFAAPTIEATRLRAEWGDLPNPYGQPYNFVRKMASNFGWDWGPRLTTSGVWRRVALETWQGARLAAVRPSVDVADDGAGIVDIVADLEIGAAADAEPEVTLSAEIGDTIAAIVVPSGETTATVRLVVPEVERWWPAGRGEQPLYELTMTVAVDGVATDQSRRRIGFRTVEIDTTPDEHGSRFALIVNGERIWVRGFNWIPDDTFPSRVTKDRYARRIEQALAANANLLRVWGGGCYESEEFYDLCDERGVLVWQDFANACAAYPEDELAEEMRAEAVGAIDRLMVHPSLVLWCGNNECQIGWWSWGWPELVGDRVWGRGWYEELLPGLVRERDPRRPYIDGSPTSGHPRRDPNDAAHGTMHIWDVWNERDYLDYRTHRPRFAAEFGFQAPAAHRTLIDAMPGGVLRLDDPDFVHHQKAENGNEKLARWIDEHFGPVTDADDWHFLTQLNQARGLEVGVGHFRTLHDHCSGVVWWQLNDCWPAISWSVVDVEGRRKPAWYAARRIFADRALVVSKVDGVLSCVVLNDSRSAWSGALVAERVTTAGEVMEKETLLFEVDADDSTVVPLPSELAAPDDVSGELLVVTAGDLRTCWTWARDRELTGRPARWHARVVGTDGGVAVEVTAKALVRDLCLFADRIDPDADVDSQLVTLLPGERHIFVVTTIHDDPHTWAAAVRPPVLRAANDRSGQRGRS
jgi:beta-mannosidase